MSRELTLDDFPEISKQLKGINKETNYIAVKRAIKTGTLLLKIKPHIPHGEWLSFIKNNFKMSLRTCQVYMKLSRENINKKYWHLGQEKILTMLKLHGDLTEFDPNKIIRKEE